MTVTEVHIRAH